MDLTCENAEFTAAWINKNCTPQPEENDALTWFVTANTLYRDYVRAAQGRNKPLVDFNAFWAILQLAIPGVKAGRAGGIIPVFYGLRYLSGTCF